MTNLWSFLFQTLTASAAAALLLVVKRLFLDKLSPRWQYGIWAVLALRLLIPAGLGGRYILFDWRLWLEWGKTAAERALSSALTDPFALTEVLAPVPLFPRGLPRPGSVTDVLFYLYAAGVVFWALWFFFSYLGLRRILARGTAPDGEILARLEEVCRRYGLKAPRRVAVLPGAGTAFVCGPLRPVLVLPSGRAADEKVLLHELLHLKYGDVWAGVLLCALRCLHWCNPLIWYCCDRAQNDCEALCDQRVLERLEGEERRDYGKILLSMADDAHARAPGTSSMANGARNIKSRIQSIARFRRYPAGMALASGCVAAALALTCLVGTAPDSRAVVLDTDHPSLAMAQALLNRPSTPAGALDTYAKALLTDSGTYLSMVTAREEQETLWRRLEDSEDFRPGLSAPLAAADFPWLERWEQGMAEPERAYQAQWQVLNLRPDGAGGCRGLLILRPADPGSDCPPLAQNVRVSPDGPAWSVAAEGPLEVLEGEFLFSTGGPDLPAVTYATEAGGLRLEIEFQSLLWVDSTRVQESGLFSFSTTAVDTVPRPSASFTEYRHSSVGGRAREAATGREVSLPGVRLVPLASDGREGGSGTVVSLPSLRDGGGGGFSFGQGVGLDWVDALSLKFSWQGQDYTCTARPVEVTP